MNRLHFSRSIVAVRLRGHQVDWRPRNAWVPPSIRYGLRPDWKHISLGPLGRINYGKVEVMTVNPALRAALEDRHRG